MSGQRYANQLPAPEAQPSNQIVPTAGQMAQRRTVIPSRKGLEIKSTNVFNVTRMGLEVVSVPTEQEWADFGTGLAGVDEGLQWVWGDWYLSGNHEWASYKAFAEHHNMNWRRIEDYAYVCRNVPISLRNEMLSFSHHKAVAGFFDEDSPIESMARQTEALQYAIDNQLSVSKFRAALMLGDADASPALPEQTPAWEKPVQIFESRMVKLWQKMERPERDKAILYLESLLTTLKAQE